MADLAFIDSLTPEQNRAFQRLLEHAVDATLAVVKGLTPAQPENKCRCGLPIAKRNDGTWVHVGPNGQTDRGCRAALFDVDEDAWWAASGNKNMARPAHD